MYVAGEKKMQPLNEGSEVASLNFIPIAHTMIKYKQVGLARCVSESIVIPENRVKGMCFANCMQEESLRLEGRGGKC